MKKLLVFILCFVSQMAFAFVLTKTESGADLRWREGNVNITLYSDPTPLNTNLTTGISSSQVISILNNSTSQWNAVSPYKINPLYTTSLPAVGSGASFRFSNNPAYFSSGVLAITSLSYNGSTGDIFSADILMNEYHISNTKFSNNPADSVSTAAYLGNVITHELGHFLGLSHSETIESSMLFSVFKGQDSIHTDDIAAIRKLYGVDQSIGALKGRVIGGESIPVFGASVTAISTKTGKAVQGQLTDQNGEFFFENLDLNDSYYILISPLKGQTKIPDFYKTVNSNFCNQKAFQPTFFTKCGGRDKGRPQAFFLDSSNDYYNVGDITIRCDQNLDPAYLANKFKTSDRQYEIFQSSSQFATVFNGVFFSSEILAGTSGKGDEFTVDLRNLDTGSISLSSYLLDLKLMASGIGSGMNFEVKVKRTDQSSWTTYNSSLDSNLKVLTDFNIALNLSDTKAHNLFEVEIRPKSLSPNEVLDIFSSSLLLNETAIYTVNAQVGTYTGSNFNPLVYVNSSPYEDNAYCTEGEIEFTSSAYTPLSTSNLGVLPNADDENPLGVGCGTVDFDNHGGPGGGMMSFLLGFIAIFSILHFRNIRHNSLSNQ